MGPGYSSIRLGDAWRVHLGISAGPGLLKIVATTLSFLQRTPGGMFAPTLFVGAMLGASIGTFEKSSSPTSRSLWPPMRWLGWACCSLHFFVSRSPRGSSWARSQRQLLQSCCPSFWLIPSPTWFLAAYSLTPFSKRLPTRMAWICPPWRNSGKKTSCTWRTLAAGHLSGVRFLRYPAGIRDALAVVDAPVLLVKLRDGSWYSMNRKEYGGGGGASSGHPD